MKKIVLTVVAMLSMTMAFAEGNEKEGANETVNLRKNYDMTVSYASVARFLGMNSAQTSDFEAAYEGFYWDMHRAAKAKSDEVRVERTRKAIKRNLARMHYVLNEAQMKKYRMALNTTMVNRGITF